MADPGVLVKSEGSGPSAEAAKAFADGRRVGLATAALAVGVVSFLSLLGAEKAVLAVVLGALAIRGAGVGTSARRRGVAAIVLGGLFVVTLAVFLVLFADQFAQLVQSLHKLS